MKIDRLLFPVTALGPGNRLVLWTKGCSRHCKNCANPELWDSKNAKEYSPENIFNIIKNIDEKTPIDGVTISGGEPFEQIDDLLILLEMLKTITDDIIVFTGYTFEELKRNFSSEEVEEIQELISVLIDGEYKHELNDNESSLRGSTNQNIIFFDESKKEKYSEYLKRGRTIQNVYMGKKLISVGIHNK
ncbi:MAG: radical SAM protein [Clostridia bacterium]|nr:radical SAM protein [Clostridia bacterium]